MSQDNMTDLPKLSRKEMRMTGRLTNGRIKINWIIWMNARQVKNDCMKMKRNMSEETWIR